MIPLRALVLSASATLLPAWGPGSHAYVAHRLRGTGPHQGERLYGAIAPDFNLLRSISTADPLFRATHYQPLRPWEEARSPQERALAWGFATHNEAWGADRTAHIASLTLPDTGRGYVIHKAAALQEMLLDQVAAAGQHAFLPLITLENCHFILEYGLDLLARRLDPELGDKVLASAALCGAAMGALVARAYARGDPEGGAALAAMEGLWRTFMVRYGHLLTLPEDQALPLMAGFLVDLGVELQILPSLAPDLRPTLEELIELGLADTLALCAPDFGLEIDATILALGNGPLNDLER